MKKILINYADKTYYKSQRQNTETGLSVGGFTDIIEYGAKNINDDFYNKNRSILDHPRGAGYWLWKPYIILETLNNISTSDVLFYCDAGVNFIESFNDYLFDINLSDEKGLTLFSGEHINKKYTKRDCFHYMDCDNKKYTDCIQLTASFQLCRRTDFTLDFYREYLKFAQDYRVISDAPNECGKDNYPEFIDHRHDQSILTLLQQKYDVSTIEDISQWGNSRREEGHKQLMQHHRGTINGDRVQRDRLIEGLK